MVSERFVHRWVTRLRAEVPDAVAVFLGGSVVRGEAGYQGGPELTADQDGPGGRFARR
jgi:hypothetical protein